MLRCAEPTSNRSEQLAPRENGEFRARRSVTADCKVLVRLWLRCSPGSGEKGAKGAFAPWQVRLRTGKWSSVCCAPA